MINILSYFLNGERRNVALCCPDVTGLPVNYWLDSVSETINLLVEMVELTSDILIEAICKFWYYLYTNP